MGRVSKEGTPSKLELLHGDEDEKLRGGTFRKVVTLPFRLLRPLAFVPQMCTIRT